MPVFSYVPSEIRIPGWKERQFYVLFQNRRIIIPFEKKGQKRIGGYTSRTGSRGGEQVECQPGNQKTRIEAHTPQIKRVHPSPSPFGG